MSMLRNRTTILTAVTVVAILLVAQPAAASEATPQLDVTPATAQYVENQNLSTTQVHERTLQLNDEYTVVGEELSSNDAEFVTLYAQDAERPGPEEIQQLAIETTNFSSQGSGVGGTGLINGFMTLDNAEFGFNNGYSGQINAVGSTSVTEIEVCFNVRAYGTVGDSGVGLVYADDPCQTLATTIASMSVDKRYSAFVVYSTITANATMRTASGSFQISS